MPDYPSGTVAFLFTDIEGSTKRWESDAAAMRVAVERHFALLDAAITANDGVHFKSVGDAAQAAFPTVPDAVSAALRGQLALIAEPWGELGPFRVRMALHVGAAEPRHGDYLAPALNRLARLLGAGFGGQVLLTRAAADLARDALPAAASLRSLGEHRLRDLQQPETVFQLIHPDLLSDFPPLKSLDVQRHNLPPQATPFIGRNDAVERIVALLNQSDVRLLTLTGPGGVGKTRLALRAAEALVATFPDGVWFVDLAPLHDPELVLPAIVRALGVREQGSQSPRQALADHLAHRDLLLVLDNFEHLLPPKPPSPGGGSLAAAVEVAELLAKSPGSKALVTSRAPLRVRGESEFAVLPLVIPDAEDIPDLASIAQSEAVQLFVARATAVQPSFTLSAENAPAVLEICRRLDGLPLAIELAAARVRILPPVQLLARLDDRLRLLTGGPRDAPARQQTLRQTVAWSHDLLAPREQSLFRRLSVFAGHPTLATVEAVIDPKGEDDVLDTLASLVEKNLLQQSATNDGEPRFAMLQSVRAFALEELAAHGEEAATREAHARHFVQLVDGAHLEIFGPEQEEWLDRFESDHDDLRDALRWLREQRKAPEAIQFVEGLWRFWLIRGYLSEGVEALSQVLDLATTADSLARARALVALGTLAGALGDFDRAMAVLAEAVTLAQGSGDDLVLARAHSGVAVIALDQGDFQRATAENDKALALYRQAGFPTGIAQSLIGLGTLAAIAGENDRAMSLLAEAVNLLRSMSDDWLLAMALANLGQLAFASGDLTLARSHSEEALTILRRLGDRSGEAALLANLGEVLLYQGDPEQAAALCEAGLAIARELDDTRHIAANLVNLAAVDIARERHAQAMISLRESLELAQEIDDWEGAARDLEVLAAGALASGATRLAVRALAAGDTLRAAIGVPLSPIYRTRRDTVLATARDRLGEAEFAHMWESIRTFSLEEAVSLVREVMNESSTAANA